MLEAIVAVYSDWGIGLNGSQPIVVKEDRKHFREVTGSSALIAGYKTMLDFPGGKPLKGRTNIILSHKDISIEDALVVHSVDEALEKAAAFDRVFVIGGASIYREFLPYIHRVYVTKIDALPVSDVFFPNLDEDKDWQVSRESDIFESDGIKYSFASYERIIS